MFDTKICLSEVGSLMAKAMFKLKQERKTVQKLAQLLSLPLL